MSRRTAIEISLLSIGAAAVIAPCLLVFSMSAAKIIDSMKKGESTVSTTEQESGFWALVELFGHQQIAGFVSSQTIGGEAFIRVDVPRTEKQENWSKLFGKGAIYAITPMAEDLVKQKASSLEVAPLTAWDLPEEWRDKIKQKALPSPPSHELDEFDDDDKEDDYDEGL
jgi:hypothetical protein